MWECVLDNLARSHPSDPRKRREDYRAEPQGKRPSHSSCFPLKLILHPLLWKGIRVSSYRKCIKRIWGETRTPVDGMFQAIPGRTLWGAGCLGTGSTHEGICVHMYTGTYAGTPAGPHAGPLHLPAKWPPSLLSLTYIEMLVKARCSPPLRPGEQC